MTEPTPPTPPSAATGPEPWGDPSGRARPPGAPPGWSYDPQRGWHYDPQQAWGSDVGWGGDPNASMDPYDPRRNPPPSSFGGPYGAYDHQRRPWYKSPGHLIGAATFSAIFAWITVLSALVGESMMRSLDNADGIEEFFFGIFMILFAVIAWIVGATSFFLSLGGAAATIPAAVHWFRDPRRSSGPGFALIHAVVAWAVTAVVLVRVLG